MKSYTFKMNLSSGCAPKRKLFGTTIREWQARQWSQRYSGLLAELD